MKIKAPKDFWAGLMFIAFGVGFAVGAQNYQMGSAVRMGPAYFPTMLGAILAAIGLWILIQSFIVQGAQVPRFYFKPIILIIAGIVLFGVVLKPLGLVIATALLIVVGALGGLDFRWKEIAVLCAVLAVFSVFVFVKGLGLPFPVWPGQ